jgi:hypothetical protein
VLGITLIKKLTFGPRLVTIILIILSTTLLAACASDPEIIVVEITRLVPQVEEVEVTRIVEIEKEVTRLVQVPMVVTGTPKPSEVEPLDLERLHIDIWPDYDEPAVLVLLTGEVPAGAPFPYEIAIPIPPKARINAVAEVNQNGMNSIEYRVVNSAVHLRGTAPAFRVEYYVPYQRDEAQRTYDFQWLAPFSVAELAVQIQRPANAIDFAGRPEPTAVYKNPNDGLDYYQLEPVTVPTGSSFDLSFSYTMSGDTLTVDQLDGSSPNLPGSPFHDQQACGVSCRPFIN